MTCLPLRGKQLLIVSLHLAFSHKKGHGPESNKFCQLPRCSPLASKEAHSHPHFEVVIELHFPFDEQLNGLLVALVILSPVKAEPSLKASKRYRRIYCYNCLENAIMAFISAISHIHITSFLMLIFIQIQIQAFRK